MDSYTWNKRIASLPDPQLLQTWEWGQLKASYGWQTQYRSWDQEAASLILKRRLPLSGFAARLSILYAPRGPLLDWSNASLRRQVLDDLKDHARQEGSIFIKIDPFIIQGTGLTSDDLAHPHPLANEITNDLRSRGWQLSQEQVQFQNTVMIDLTPTEDSLLANMKQKTRYNIRLAEKKGVRIRTGTEKDVSLLYKMYAETSLRDRFTIRDETYYQRAWGGFLPESNHQQGSYHTPIAEPLIAEVDGEPVAAVIVYRFAQTGWYLFGMSRQLHRDKMPNYLLQWEAMKRLKYAGCTRYDLWGAPDGLQEDDPLWGVFRFKEGLGGVVVRSSGAWDLPIRPSLYRFYTRALPRLLEVMRRRGKERTKQAVNAV